VGYSGRGRHCKPKSSFFVTSSIFCAEIAEGVAFGKIERLVFCGLYRLSPQCWMR
jgi:hypothetical protein